MLPDAAGAEDNALIVYKNEVACLGTSLHQPALATAPLCYPLSSPMVRPHAPLSVPSC